MYIKSAIDNPVIKVDCNSGDIQISGISSPKDAAIFYRPLLVTMDYIIECTQNISFEIKLDFVDDDSCVYLEKLMTKLNKLSKEQISIHINWYWSSEEIKVLGEQYQAISRNPFNLKGVH